MNSPAARTRKPELSVAVKPGKARDRLPDRYLIEVDFVIQQAAVNDAELAKVIVLIVAGMRGGSIKNEAGNEVLESLFTVFRNNDHIHDVMRLVRECGLEVSQREVERIEVLAAKGKAK